MMQREGLTEKVTSEICTRKSFPGGSYVRVRSEQG